VRGGTFLISHAFSPEPSDMGDPSRRLISSLAALRFSFCSFDGNTDQMPKTRLMNKKDLVVLSVCFSCRMMCRNDSQHETCRSKGPLCLHAIPVVSRSRGVATAFRNVPCTWARMFRIRIVWSSLTVYADSPNSNEDHIGNDA
jgi:hypothetical protein